MLPEADLYVFGFEVVKNGLPGEFEAVAALFPTFVGAVGGVDRAVVDADRAGLELLTQSNRRLEIVGEQVGGESVEGIVGIRECLVRFLEGPDRQHGAKGLLSPELHLGRGPGEDGRAEVVTTGEGGPFGSSATVLARTVPERVLDVVFHLAPGGLRGQWAEVDGGIREAVPHGEVFGGGHESLNERIVYGVVDVDAVDAAAGLAAIAKPFVGEDLGGQVEVGIREDDRRAMPPQFQGDGF